MPYGQVRGRQQKYTLRSMMVGSVFVYLRNNRGALLYGCLFCAVSFIRILIRSDLAPVARFEPHCWYFTTQWRSQLAEAREGARTVSYVFFLSGIKSFNPAPGAN